MDISSGSVNELNYYNSNFIYFHILITILYFVFISFMVESYCFIYCSQDVFSFCEAQIPNSTEFFAILFAFSYSSKTFYKTYLHRFVLELLIFLVQELEGLIVL